MSISSVKTKRISPSQLDLWLRCNRRWAFVHRSKRYEAGTDAAQAGTETHQVLEDQGPWDKEWTGPQTGKVYQVGHLAKLLQAQTPEGVVAREKRWEVELQGLPFVGVTDFFSEQIVGDYKTTGSIKNAKKPGHREESKDLLIDPQRLFYTQLVPSATKTLWLYGAWDTMTVTPRELDIDREADKKRLHLRVLKPAETMLAVPDDVDPLSLKPNVNDCHLFPAPGGKGGCPFKAECFPPGKLQPVIKNSKESNEAMTSLIEQLRAKSAAAGNEPLPAAEPTPERMAPVKSVETVTIPVLPIDPAAEAVVDRAVKAAPEPKRRGRKLKAAETAPEQAADSVPQEPATCDEPSRANPSAAHLIGTLYVDCLPLSGGFRCASELIAEASEQVCNDLQVPHIGLVDFAKGTPAMAAQLRANLSGRYINRLYLETRSAEGKACVQILMSVAREIVKGVF